MAPKADLRTIAAEEFAAFHRCAAIAFHESPDEETLARQAHVQELDRSWAVLEGREIVATSTAYSVTLSIPGGELACAAISWLTVLPTHRRRGMLTRLLQRLFADAHERDEPVAALWSTTAGVYHRFGFGPAVAGSDFHIDIGTALPRMPVGSEPPSELRLEPADTATPVLAALYDRARRERGGMPSRSEAWWAHRLLAGNRRLLVARDFKGDACGYALYQTRGVPPTATVELIELVAHGGLPQATLWRYLCGLELATVLEAPHRPVDDPLPFLFDDIRQARLAAQRDCLWLRLLDVPRALEQRRWARDARLILDVRDVTVKANHGLWLLETAADGQATCSRIAGNETADLVLDVAELGAAYLGGVTLARLAAAGRVEEVKGGSIAALDDALRVPLAPWTPEHF